MKLLLTISAALECGIGIAFLVIPSVVATSLFGVPLETPVGLVVGRALGGAILSLGIACGFSRDAQGISVAGLVKGMLFYNLATVSLLAYASLGVGISGTGLWPVVLLHLGMGVWCGVNLRNAVSPNSSSSED